MVEEEIKIALFQKADRDSVLQIWESSVAATHHFLYEKDFNEIKEFLYTFDFQMLNVYCLFCNKAMAGFIGIYDDKIEMLFLDPLYIGKGLGKHLIQFAIVNLNTTKVDVNEQNTMAVQFYRKMGFRTIERTEKDDQGRNYPLLRMKLIDQIDK